MAYRTESVKKQESLEPPQALDAEQTLLGAILKDQDALHGTLEVFDNATHFYVPKHKIIFDAILNLYNQSQPVDITTVAQELSRMSSLEKIGGRVYLVDLFEQVASTANVISYAEIVLEKSVMRSLISTSNEIVKSCYDQVLPVDELLDQAESHIFDISQKRLSKGFVSLKLLAKPTFEQIEEFRESGTGFGLRTGYTHLDTMTNGLHNGDLIIVAGRPSMGKTALALNIAEHVAEKEKKGVGIFSIEMSNESLVLRMLSTRARVSQQKIRAGKTTEVEHRRLGQTAGLLSGLQLFLDDSPSLSALEMRAKARRLKAQHDIHLIIVDYIQLMQSSRRVENRQQEIAQISRGLKVLAKELDIPVIAISQLSRQVEQRGAKEKRPQLSDLRESGAIEQDADLVMFVYRPEVYLSPEEKDDPEKQHLIGLAEIIIAKQRNGEIGTAKLQFLKEFTRFENRENIRTDLPPGVDPVDTSGPIPTF